MKRAVFSTCAFMATFAIVDAIQVTNSMQMPADELISMTYLPQIDKEAKSGKKDHEKKKDGEKSHSGEDKNELSKEHDPNLAKLAGA